MAETDPGSCSMPSEVKAAEDPFVTPGFDDDIAQQQGTATRTFNRRMAASEDLETNKHEFDPLIGRLAVGTFTAAATLGPLIYELTQHSLVENIWHSFSPF